MSTRIVGTLSSVFRHDGFKQHNDLSGAAGRIEMHQEDARPRVGRDRVDAVDRDESGFEMLL
jgi:hypothetical protein